MLGHYFLGLDNLTGAWPLVSVVNGTQYGSIQGVGGRHARLSHLILACHGD
jgi:hypothetical protein